MNHDTIPQLTIVGDDILLNGEKVANITIGPGTLREVLERNLESSRLKGEAFSEGYDTGTEEGFKQGMEEGHRYGYEEGYSEGHVEGYDAGLSTRRTENDD